MTISRKLSVIMPFVNDPWVAFTLQSIILELQPADFSWEVIVVNNWCDRVARQAMLTSLCCGHPLNRQEVNQMIYKEDDRWGHKLKDLCAIHPQTTYTVYSDKLSHWNAKNHGVKESTGDILFFIDSHCVIPKNTLCDLFNLYCYGQYSIHGSLHLPLAYIGDAPGKALVYKPVVDESKGEYHYSFTKYRYNTDPIEVPCMSTCGMMIAKNIFNSFGGWPSELGIYSGGEHFLNYVMATLGYKKYVAPLPPLYHEGKEKRGYSSDASDMIRNRFIASYMIGGDSLLELYATHSKGRPEVKANYISEIKQLCKSQRQAIESKQVITITDWWAQWRGDYHERDIQKNI